ncbi:MAG: glycosyltransferase family 2 protein [Deltaproteobacteria bacterium]|nr:glycosyltransferase family 2 protein [Deltaproteobacteria bacterium]
MTLSEHICVIIPAYNVEDSIESVVRGASRYVRKVFVADDGSTDATAEKAASAGADILRIEENRGKGHALKMLFERAGSEEYSAVISMDGDGQHDPDELPRFIAAYLEYPDNIIVGSRMHAGENIPRARYNSMHVARFYISFASNQFIEDTQCGYRVYPLDIIKQMQLTQDRYVTESEILIKAGDMGRRIRFVRIRAIYGQIRSHFRPILDITAITTYIISYFMYKFFVEGIFSDKPNTYKKGNLRDKIASYRRIDLFYQMATVFMGLPLQSVYTLMHILLPVFIKNNFASARRLDHGFFRITLGSYLLPVILLIIIFEKIAGYFGVKLQYVDGFIQTFYPNLWDGG